MKYNQGLPTYYFGLDEASTRGREPRSLQVFPRARQITKIPVLNYPVEYSDRFHLSLNVGGVDSRDIAVVVEGSQLIIEIEKEFDPYKVAQSNWDKCYGVFYRTFDLPPGIEGDQVQCTLNDGVLEVEILKGKPLKKVIPRSVETEALTSMSL